MCVCVYTHLYCVCHSHLYSVVLSVCLDLDRSCVISTSELSVKFSYACKKVRSLTEKKQHRLMDVFFFFFFTGSCHKFVVPISFIQIFILVLMLKSHCRVKIKHNQLRTGER